jgi:transcriptional regulator with XRE-family HTH domain
MSTKFLQFMEAYGLSQYRLHRKTGFSRSQISEWMRGLHRPSLQSARQIAARLGLPIEAVLAQIETRESYQNDIAPTGEFVARQKKNRPVSDQTNDANRTDGTYCLTCRRLLDKAA